ncbi:hypothetical protein BDY17DRAFT_57274 [Neohortaea acidophila]|uniref:Thaumatin n=1 Tax=Neohortaea acidophila TaxID=245834 RepID=A0A6A6PFD5_9PEZI|nr:uncharacterized protein BDY17DRAFT_57274 [Neohortaea acidophila]KAF2478698.1 hypothetical protein BDY17DRAFT_57274 [Neohortaea acidophila]
MLFTDLSIAALLASTAAAVPFAGHDHSHRHLHRKQSNGNTFNINVVNSCSSSRSVGLFQITSAFQMLSMSTPVTLQPGENTTVAAPYQLAGMRLSGTADQGTAAQWLPQALFEFGYSAWGSVEGTAYDLSLMTGTTDGMSVVPANSNCESKSCSSPLDCPVSQAWTNPNQDAIGSPADTTCYYGLTDFDVVFCPSSSSSY